MELLTFENLIALLSLTALEIVLGIDNIVFISIVVGKLEKAKQELARKVGLILAMGLRILLLLAISWIMQLTTPLFSIFEKSFSGRDIILIVGGLFLIGKATFEIHDKIDEVSSHQTTQQAATSFASAIIQILMLDIIFSLDSVITAVGMVDEIMIMVFAIVIAVGTMLIFAKRIGDFIEKHPTFKMLALSFLVMVGVMLVADGFGHHIERGYVYFALGFSLMVEFINIKVRRPTREPN